MKGIMELSPIYLCSVTIDGISSATFITLSQGEAMTKIDDYINKHAPPHKHDKRPVITHFHRRLTENELQKYGLLP